MISERCLLGLSDDELSRWRDNDLNPARMALIRVHAATCAACRERLAALEAIGVGLRRLDPRQSTSSGCWQVWVMSGRLLHQQGFQQGYRSARATVRGGWRQVRQGWRRCWSSRCWPPTSSRRTARYGQLVTPDLAIRC